MMSNSNFSFRPILITALKRGITYSAIFAFITTGWFVVLVSITSNEFILRLFAQESTTVYFMYILTIIFVVIILTLLAFIFIGFPVMILPAILSSSLLSFWLYSDFKNDKLSLSTSRMKGALVGGFSGLAPGLIFFFRDAIESNPLTLFTHQDFFGVMFGIGLFVLPFIFGGLAGFLLGTQLTIELNKSEVLIEPEEESLQ